MDNKCDHDWQLNDGDNLPEGKTIKLRADSDSLYLDEVCTKCGVRRVSTDWYD